MSEKGKRCEYCLNPHDGQHNDGCPMIDKTAMSDWKRGRAYGFDDITIEWWRGGYLTRAFVLGCRVGKEEIDTLVEEAAESRYEW